MYFSHTEQHIKKTLEIYSEVLKKLETILENENKLENYLEGEKVQPVFRAI